MFIAERTVKIPLDRRSRKSGGAISAEPVYLQIRDRISRLIQAGLLQPGDRLPSIRKLAEEAQVNKLTVIEAYGVLEADGLIYARLGAGYFVSQPPSTQSVACNFAPKQDVIIPETGEMSYFDICNAAAQAYHQGDMINFALGFPHPGCLDDLQRVARRAMKGVADTLFRYDFPQGQLVLRKQIAQLLIQNGLEVSPENLIVTNGSMQGLSLVMRYYLQPGDWVVVETPSYHGALAVLQELGAKVIGIPMSPDGMNLTLLEQYLHSHRPKLIYTISTLHNPTGITTSQTHRQQLLKLAKQYGCAILEDNAYEGLNFEAVPPPIKAFDDEDRVIYLGTFSKTLMPGLRVGYMVVTGAHYRSLLQSKLLSDFHVSTVSQAIVSEYLASGHYRRYLNQLRSSNLSSRDAMLKAIEQHFPAEATWTVPDGGLFLWVTFPDNLPIQAICHEAASEKILVVPGATFFPNQQGYPTLRLNFSQPIDNISRGIAVLGKLFKEHLRS